MLLARLAISMAVVMGVMGLAARFVRRRQGMGGGGMDRGGLRPGEAGRRGRGVGATGPGRANGKGGAGLLGLGGRGRASRPLQPVEVIFRRPLAKGANVALVQAGGRQYLLGVTEQSVNLLAEVPTEPSAALAEDELNLDRGTTPLSLASGPARPASPGLLGNIDQLQDWQHSGRRPVSLADAPEQGPPENAWKLAIDSLRERTVRR
jgi:Flagellar biosynthesis protein, FliO